MKMGVNLVRFVMVSVILQGSFRLYAQAQTPTSSPAPMTHVRAMTANLSSGNHQNYDNGEAIRIFQALKPDVVMIQEFNYKSNSETDLTEMILTAFSGAFSFYRESEATDHIPNGIISRFPILESNEWTDPDMPDRDFSYARMDIPGEPDLWAISVHLSSSKPAIRLKEVGELKAMIAEKIPATDYVLLGGDFNTTTRQDPTVQAFADVVFEKAAPTDSKGDTTTNITRRKNYDWVLNNANLSQYQVATEMGRIGDEALEENVTSYPHGLVFDSSIFPRLDRLNPVVESDSHAPGMQHLPVVKDYEVPSTGVETGDPEVIGPAVVVPE